VLLRTYCGWYLLENYMFSHVFRCLTCAILLQDELMPRYAELVYNGFWFSPERRALQAAIDETQKFCTGTVRVKLYKVATLLDCP